MKLFTFCFLFFVLFFPIQASGTIVTLQVEPAKLQIASGELKQFAFKIINHSRELISERRNFFLSYHLYDQQGKLISFENRRWSLPVMVFPGRTVTFRQAIFFNHPPGSYRLQWELLREGHFWGREHNWQSALQEVVITDLFRQPPPLQRVVFKKSTEDLRHFELLVQQTLKNNAFFIEPDLLAFSAGSDYPQCWLRDLASAIFAVCEYYRSEDVERLLHFLISAFIQNGPSDWFNASAQNDLNSVASDQESSLILAAGEYFRRNPQWIVKKIDQKTILDLLDQIMSAFLERCLDRETGLIRSGYTIDWGDVSRDYSDQRALKLSKQSKISFNLFFQARALRAALVLQKMAQSIGQEKLRSKWADFYQKLKQRVRAKFILSKERYLAIRYLPAGIEPLEKKILAVGGNCEAILAGIMKKDEIRAFLNELLRRQKELKLFSGSFVLLPPYPENYFPHHLLRHPFIYQNGGLWDWIGARLLEVLYDSGFKQEAAKFQEEIIRRTINEKTFWEWYDFNGNGRGAFAYTAAAGELFRVIFKQQKNLAN